MSAQSRILDALTEEWQPRAPTFTARAGSRVWETLIDAGAIEERRVTVGRIGRGGTTRVEVRRTAVPASLPEPVRPQSLRARAHILAGVTAEWADSTLFGDRRGSKAWADLLDAGLIEEDRVSVGGRVRVLVRRRPEVVVQEVSHG